jgi:hypothetical protein
MEKLMHLFSPITIGNAIYEGYTVGQRSDRPPFPEGERFPARCFSLPVVFKTQGGYYE